MRDLSDQLEEQRGLAMEKYEELSQVSAQLAVAQQGLDQKQHELDTVQQENSQLQVCQ